MESTNSDDSILCNVDCKVIHGFSDINSNELKKIYFCCLHLNIRSCRKNWNAFYANINKYLNYVHVIVLVDTNIKEYENNFYTIEGFNAEFLNRNERRGGGVAMYIKDNIKYERVNCETTAYESIEIKIQ